MKFNDEIELKVGESQHIAGVKDNDWKGAALFVKGEKPKQLMIQGNCCIQVLGSGNINLFGADIELKEFSYACSIKISNLPVFVEVLTPEINAKYVKIV